MKILQINNNQPQLVGTFKNTVKDDIVKRDIPTIEENPAAFALFTGISQSEKFTADAAYQAFADVARQPKSD